MIYMNLKFYLRTNLKKASVDFKWTEDDNRKIFAHLNNHFSFEYLSKARNRSEIKQAFIDFFEPIGYILFRLKDNKIALKIFPYKIEPKDSKYSKILINIILANKNLVDFNYKGRSDQIVIQHKLRRNLYHYVDDITDEQINKKELIKYVVKNALQLQDNDLVLNKKRKIFIKTLPNKVRKKILKDTPSEANRYNGYSEDELKKLSDEYFDSDAIDSFLQLLSFELFKNIFLQKQINNSDYEKSIYSLIQNTIAEELSEFTDKDIEFRKGFAGYIFRINFIKVFTYISNEILKHVYLKDEYITSWLKYYDGSIIIDDKKRYISPELLNSAGQRLNPTAIYINISVWFKSKKNILRLKKEHDKVLFSMDKLLIENQTPIDYKETLLEEQKNEKNILNSLKINFENMVEKKYETKDKELLSSIVKKINDIKENISESSKKIITINENIKSINTYDDYKRLEVLKINFINGIRKEEKIILENTDTYLSIRSAILKVLTSKRKAI